MRDIRITTLGSAGDGGSTLDGECTDGRTCPGVHVVSDRPGLYYVVTSQVTDPQELQAFAALVGPGEALGTIPREVLDRVAGRSPS
jgi:hypothetical protein